MGEGWVTRYYSYLDSDLRVYLYLDPDVHLRLRVYSYLYLHLYSDLDLDFCSCSSSSSHPHYLAQVVTQFEVEGVACGGVGRISRYSPDDGEGMLFHVLHDDGDEEV